MPFRETGRGTLVRLTEGASIGPVGGCDVAKSRHLSFCPP